MLLLLLLAVLSALLLQLPQTPADSPSPVPATSCQVPLLAEVHHGATHPGPPGIFHIPRQTEVCPGLASHRAASLWKENSKTLYGVKSCLDGRVGSWYARVGRVRGKCCRAKPSRDETLSGRHSNSRREKKSRQRPSFKRAGKDYVGL